MASESELPTDGVRKTGLVGQGISYSLSPALHHDAASRLGLRVSYELFDIPAGQWSAADALTAVARCRDAGFVGLNITQPYKEAVIPLLDSLDEVAQTLQAVNTIHFTDSGAHGYNTDAYGFGVELEALDGDMSRVVQFGAGGAGAATAYAALAAGTNELTIFDLRVERAQSLVRRLRDAFPDRGLEFGPPAMAESALASPAGVINASTKGSIAHPGSPLDIALLSTVLWVADVIYAPPRNRLIKDANRKGIPARNGGLMLVHQAARSFELFHDVVPDAGAMWEHFTELTRGA